MKRNFVLYILVMVAGFLMLNGCGIFYHGVYSGKAPNSVYRGDSQGTPGLRVQPMEFGLTQEQMDAMSPEEFDAYMDKLDRYNESMERASHAEGYDAAAKSGWTRYHISPPQDPSSAPSPSELRRLRRLEWEARQAELRDQRMQRRNANSAEGANALEQGPKPRKSDYATEAEYREAYRLWLEIGKEIQDQRKAANRRW